MSKITINKSDAYDLSIVLSQISHENAETLEFQDIITLEVAASSINGANDGFVKKYEAISSEQTKLVEVAREKVASFKKKHIKKAEDGTIDEDFSKVIEAYTNEMTVDLQVQIKDNIQPRFDELYETTGKGDVEIEMEESIVKTVVDNFEKFAKTKYTNKKKMAEVYKVLSEA